MKLLAAIQRFVTEPDTSEVDRLRLALRERTELHAGQLEESDAQWRAQITELINQHCDERREWAREKRELTAQLTSCTNEVKLCLGEVASGQRREVRQAAVLGSVPQDYKDEGYELVATMLDNSYQTLDVVVGSDYESQEEMNAAMQSIQAVHALRLEGQTLRLTWEPLSDD